MADTDKSFGHDHDAHMVADFKKRFYISLAITVPVLLLSSMIQSFLGLRGLGFAGDQYVLFAFFNQQSWKCANIARLCTCTLHSAFFLKVRNGKKGMWEIFSRLSQNLLDAHAEPNP